MNLRLRERVGSVAPDRSTVKSDALAGLPVAVGGVPDGMAAAVLAGVNPVYGLYASFVGPIAGGLTSSTQLMVITTTSAAALTAGSTLTNVQAADRPEVLVLLTLMAGVMMMAAGLLKLGRYTRFVSISVMIGFLTGVATNIVLGQLGNLTGAQVTGSIAIAKAWDLITHPGRIELASTAVGLGALAIVAFTARTRLRAYAAVFGLVIPTVASLGVDSIARVQDDGKIPTGVPLPHLPDLSVFSPDLLAGAAAIAVLVLVQGAGVAESAPNPSGKPSRTDRDFLAAGIGNLASAIFRGQPVGGSVGQTALNLAAGARSRWAPIFAGFWMLAILVAFSGIVGKVPIPTLAGILVYAAVRSIRIPEIQAILRTGSTSQVAIVTTYLSTLFLPIAAAVGIGVALSLLLQLNRDALDLTIVELVPSGDTFEERPAPDRLPSHQVTVLHVYGSLFYAGARTLQAHLPDPAGAEEPVVVFRLRGRSTLGATAFLVLGSYAEKLREVGGRLYLSGVDPVLIEQMSRSRRVEAAGKVEVYAATPRLGESTLEAYEDAEHWLITTDAHDSEDAPQDV